MPNTREKLIELIDEALKRTDGIARVVGKRGTEKIADHLIAHGVTMQEQIRDHYWATEQAYKNGYEKGKADALQWISVKDRLPDERKDEYVLVVCDYHGKIKVETRKMWHIDSVVTHWQPLPEPPKENNNGQA